MTDWGIDPAAAEHYAKTMEIVVKGLVGLRDRFARRKPKRKVNEELDALTKEVQQFIDLMTRHLESQAKFMETLVGMLNAVRGTGISQVQAHVALLRSTAHATGGLQRSALAHETRLKALEARARVKRPKRKRRPSRPKGK